MMFMRAGIVVCLLGAITQLSFAQVATDNFTIRMFAGADTVGPTTPTLLSVTPVAQTQIDLRWSTSTDNFLVAGYSVLRDSVPIATTTLTNYSDTGLLASTTYQYEVRAFDTVTNYSSTSAAVSTTTLATPVVVVVDEESVSTTGTVARAVIEAFDITVGTVAATIDLATARPGRIELRWGRTASYELGYVTSDTYSSTQSIYLTDLEPGTTYEYELIGYSPYGIKTVLKRGQFTTLLSEGQLRPANVSRFTAIASESDVRLDWQLPAIEDVSYVRIVRSHLGFPQHPQDGAIVYQGQQTSAIDAGVLAQYSPVYYTAFTYDVYGTISSGAVAIVYAWGLSSPGDIAMPDQGATGAPGDEEAIFLGSPTSTIAVEAQMGQMLLPELEDIFVTQGDRLFSLAAANNTLLSDQSFRLSISSEVISPDLKSIIVTLLDPTDNSRRYSFLLRLNSDQSAYEAVLAPLHVVGQSRFIVEIFDYQANIVSTYKSPVTFVVGGEETVIFPDAAFESPAILVLASALLLLFVMIILLLFRLRAEDKK